MPNWKKVIVSGSNALLNNVNIGEPEDSTYTDGLYTDFNNNTNVGVAVDRFNTILKGLSPSSAPNLDNLESLDNGENNLYLAFGDSQPTSSYSNALGTGSRTAVDFTQQFNRISGDNGYLRLGVLDSTQTLNLVLNEDVIEDSDAFINYPANAFNVPINGGESYTLDINGTLYTENTTNTGSLNGTYFTLSEAQTGSFKGTGQPFEIFRHRTGQVEVLYGDFREGWNYIRVLDSEGNLTNFVDFIYDPAASPGNFTYSFNGFTTSSVNPTGTKYLSGIQYYTDISYTVTGSVSNYYKNTYSKNNLSFGNLSPNLSATSITIPDPTTDADDLLQINSNHNFGTGRLLNETLTSRLTITNAFGKTGNTGNITTPTILLDNVNTSNTNQVENFCKEDKRLPVATYNTQNDVSSALNTFPSGSDLDTDELAIYNGAVRYPTTLLNNGNISGANITYAYPGQPNYSSATGDRKFVRFFQNNSGGSVANMNINIKGNATIVDTGTSLNSNNIHVRIKYPGNTAFLDLGKQPNTGDDLQTDNMGCLVGSLDSNIDSNGASNEFLTKTSNGGAAVTNNEYIIIEIIANSSFTGNISQITLSF